MRPQKQDHIAYFEHYINLVSESDINSALKNNHQTTLRFLKSIPSSQFNYQYAPNKWTIKEVINHIIDTERVFSYRVLCFSRGETQVLPGFDENVYAANSGLSKVAFEDLVMEFDIVRQATIIQFSHLSNDKLLLKGKSAAGENNVLSLGYMIAGHTQHHINVIKERYLT